MHHSSVYFYLHMAFTSHVSQCLSISYRDTVPACRAHPKSRIISLWDLNLIMSTKSLFPYKVIYTGTGWSGLNIYFRATIQPTNVHPFAPKLILIPYAKCILSTLTSPKSQIITASTLSLNSPPNIISSKSSTSHLLKSSKSCRSEIVNMGKKFLCICGLVNLENKLPTSKVQL